MKLAFAAVAILLFAGARSNVQEPSFVDMVITHGHVWTVDPQHPRAEAVAIRATLDGKNPGGWFPEQKLTLEEVIQAYTMGSAYAEFREKEKGSLTPGKFADVVVLDSDLFSIAPEKIKDAAVRFTIVGGKIVYEAGKN